MTLDAGEAGRDVVARFEKAVAIARTATAPADSDPMWDLLYEAAHEVSAAAGHGLAHLDRADPVVREVACHLLGVVAGVDETSRPVVAEALLRRDGRETSPAVITALVRAAGPTVDPRTLPMLVRHADRDDPRVRLAVATSLTSVMWAEPAPAGVAALLRLTADADPEVRNWATFGLGWQLAADGTDIRAALWARTSDEFADAREEGIRGLARRHDARAVPLVAELLNAADAHVFTFDAAAYLGHESLLPLLAAFDPTDRGVGDAIAACDPLARAVADESAWALFTTVAGRYPELPIALYCDRYEPGVYLDVAPIGDGTGTAMAGWLVPELLHRAGDDVSVAADLLAADVREAAGIIDAPE